MMAKFKDVDTGEIIEIAQPVRSEIPKGFSFVREENGKRVITDGEEEFIEE